MNPKIDFVLVGTGLAPLVAAKRLIQQGYEIALCNPDHDFFVEESELPFDPLIPFDETTVPSPARCDRSRFEKMLEILGPEYPGALEQWPRKEGGFHDSQAAHIRDRQRLWIPASPSSAELFEQMFVESLGKDFKARIIEGVAALKRFPGFGLRGGGHEVSGILASRLGDVDVSKYRRGFLEFLRTKLPPENVCLQARDIEISKAGVRMAHPQGGIQHWRPAHSVLVFQTPRIASWLERRMGFLPPKGLGTRLWEEWTLSTREPIALDGIGIFGNMAVWSDPETEGRALRVLRGGEFSHKIISEGALTAESFKEMSFLFESFLRWEHFSVRRYRFHWLHEFDEENFWDQADFKFQRLYRLLKSDGPVHEIVHHVSVFLDEVLD